MKISMGILVAASCAVTASAFVVGRGSSVASLSKANFGVSRTMTPRSASTVRMMESADFVKAEIASADVVVFSKSFCPFCTRTKRALKDLSIEAKIFELDKMDNGADIQNALADLSGQRTVPNVFIKGEHLGGNDDTQNAVKTGELQKMLGL